jgi:hypothetical protein
MPQKDEAVASLPSGIGVREVRADVAERRRAQDRVGDRVRQDVRVGMAFQAEFTWDRHATQDQGPPRRETMHVPAEAHPDLGQGRAVSA